MIKINAQRLTAAIIEVGLGEVELCIKAGIAHQTFSKMRKGQMVRYPSVSRVCKVLDVNPAEIVMEVPDEIIQARG